MITTPPSQQPSDAPIAIITGSTSGIGQEIVHRLARDGLSIVVTGRDTTRGTRTASDLATSGIFVDADLTVAADRERLIHTTIETYGRLDVLVNNAAADHTGDLLSIPETEIDELFRINTTAAITLTQLAAQHMTGGGVIINITSRLATIGVPTMSLYSASKGALQAFTTAAAVELAPRNIRINAVAPGMTRTPLYDAWLSAQPDPGATEKAVIADIPLGRLATPSDVAAAVSYLASPDAAYLTGITIPVDGGYTAR